MKLIKQTAILLILSFILLYCKSEENNQKKPNTSSIKNNTTINYPDLVIKNRIVNFGVVPKDTVLKANYTLINPSEKDLIIEYINPDCSCTSYSVTNDTIFPKNKAIITLTLNTKEKIGNQKIDAIIKTNSETKFYKIILKAVVK